MEETFNETMTVHTFQITLTNLSYQEYLVIYGVQVDGYDNDSWSHGIIEEHNDFANSINNKLNPKVTLPLLVVYLLAGMT